MSAQHTQGRLIAVDYDDRDEREANARRLVAFGLGDVVDVPEEMT
jgi:hypothetical protein